MLLSFDVILPIVLMYCYINEESRPLPIVSTADFTDSSRKHEPSDQRTIKKRSMVHNGSRFPDLSRTLAVPKVSLDVPSLHIKLHPAPTQIFP